MATATMEDFVRTAERVRNWGRWGADDELGTLNHITADTIRAAAALVHQGKLFPLGINVDAQGPQPGSGWRRNPIHLMTMDGGDADLDQHVKGWKGDRNATGLGRWFERGKMRFTDDYVIMPLQSGTQWDALSHVYYDGQLYNGFDARSVTSFGATKCSIDKVDAKGIVARGVLLDVAGHRGVETVTAEQHVPPEELDDIAAAAGVDVRPGDVVLIRTGWWTRFARDGERLRGGGLSWRCAEWLQDHRVAAVAADNLSVESEIAEIDGLLMPLHLLCIREMGMMLGEIWDLDALAADCRADGVYEFQLVAQPLRVTGGVGSPVNPIALK